jgi:hypothetical protein
MPAMPIGIYHQGSRLLHALKSYYQAKEAGMSSAFIYHTRSTTLTTPSSPHFRPIPSTWAETMSSR